MAQNADLPISCKKLSVVTPPNPRPVKGHRAVRFPDSRYFGSHNFQIVPHACRTGKYRTDYDYASAGEMYSIARVQFSENHF